jgi:hypothetical protein
MNIRELPTSSHVTVYVILVKLYTLVKSGNFGIICYKGITHFRLKRKNKGISIDKRTITQMYNLTCQYKIYIDKIMSFTNSRVIYQSAL